jgi:hypothetical protein
MGRHLLAFKSLVLPTKKRKNINSVIDYQSTSSRIKRLIKD